jgi:hypothetical protein
MTESTPAPGRDKPDRTSQALTAGGILLVLLGILLGLWLWLGGDDESGPDHAADCRMMEDEAPEFGDELGMLTDLTAPHAERVDAMHDTADQFQSMADQLTDREFAEQMDDAATAMHRAGDALEKRDLTTAPGELDRIITFYGPAYEFLDGNCERWIGPGQWDEPGTSPTGPTDFPTALPTLPTGLPTAMPSMPSMPSKPVPPTSVPPTTTAPAGMPKPHPSFVTDGKPFTAVVAKSRRVWIPVRVTVTKIEQHPPGAFPDPWSGMRAVTLRWRAKNIGNRPFPTSGNPVGTDFLVTGGMGSFDFEQLGLEFFFPPWAPDAPVGCTTPVDRGPWQPGAVRTGCTAYVFGQQLKLHEVEFSSGLAGDRDRVTIVF